MRRFSQLLAGRLEPRLRNTAKALVPVSPPTAAQRNSRGVEIFSMSAQQSPLRLAPITTGLARPNPKILLGGTHQPSLLRYLDGWPKRWGKPKAFLIQFSAVDESLARFASDSFDLAVVQTPQADCLDVCIHHLTRIARKGLITRRR